MQLKNIKIKIFRLALPSAFTALVCSRLNWIGYVVRGDGLMKFVLEGRMEGKIPSGRPRMGMIDDVLDETYGDIKRKAENRELENLEAKDLPLGRELMLMNIEIRNNFLGCLKWELSLGL